MKEESHAGHHRVERSKVLLRMHHVGQLVGQLAAFLSALVEVTIDIIA